MKSTATDKPLVKDEYPILKKSDITGLIVLFTSKKTGVAIKVDKSNRIGQFSEDWLEDNFLPYTGTVTLENL